METQKNIPKLRFPEFERDWESTNLGKIAMFSKGKGISKNDISENGETECIRYGELYTYYREVIDEVISKTNVKRSELVLSEANDVIIPASGETEIDISTASCVIKSGIALSGDINIIKTQNNGVFLAYYLKNKKRIDIAQLAQGISVIHLYSKQLATLKLNLPTLPEQQKIASFFTAIDQKISQLKRKKTLLEQYKKGVMQKLFSQEIRFKDDNGQEFPRWEKKKLGLVIDEYRVITKTNNEYEVLTSSNKGLMLQKEYYGENRITERDNIGFNVLPNGYITYRSRSDNGIFTFNLNNLGITGIVSKYYPVFKIKDGSNYFLVEFINDNYKIISQYSIGTSQKVFPMNAFNNISLSIPCPKEQHKIANFLSAIDDKINHTQKQIEKAEVWKKGLMQQMFV